MKEFCTKYQVLSYIKACLIITAGTICSAVGINCFLAPHGMLSGGLTGISMILYRLTGLPTWLVLLLLNIPLFAIAWVKVSRRFTMLSLYGMLMFTLMLGLTESIRVDVDNILVAAIFGGLLTGLGGGLALRQGASMGGHDLLGVWMNQTFSISVGGFGLMVNCIVLALLAFMSGLEIAMITLISFYVGSITVGAVQEGFNKTKTVFIVSEKWQEVMNSIFETLNRGITIIHGEGGYTHSHRTILYCVIRNMELAKLKRTVRCIDPHALVSVIETREIQGRGFRGEIQF
ncbi:MAG: YitT family protein [Christensenellales bacterium]